LFILSLRCWAAGVLLRNSVPIPIVSRVFPALSCTNCKVSDLILRFLIHFERILVQGEKRGLNYSFLQADIHFSQQHLLKRLSSPSYAFGVFVKNKVAIVVYIHIWVLYSVPLVFISGFVPVPCYFYCYGTVI
jgi:hypothetical protein